MHHLEDEGAADLVLGDVDHVSGPFNQLGARFIVLIDDVYTNLQTGEQERPKELDDAAWARLIDTTNRAQERAAAYGLQVVYHPHADTHVENHRQMERFLADADPSVMLCLDTGHDAYTGGDPIAFFEKHHERIPYLHLKSIRGDLREQVHREGIPFATAVGQGMFCEPVRGGGRLRAPARRRPPDRLRRLRGGGAGHVSAGARRPLSDRQADQGVPPGHRSGLAGALTHEDIGYISGLEAIRSIRLFQCCSELAAESVPPALVPIPRLNGFGLSLRPEVDASPHSRSRSFRRTSSHGTAESGSRRVPSIGDRVPRPRPDSTSIRVRVRRTRGCPIEPSRARLARRREVSGARKTEETAYDESSHRTRNSATLLADWLTDVSVNPRCLRARSSRRWHRSSFSSNRRPL